MRKRNVEAWERIVPATKALPPRPVVQSRELGDGPAQTNRSLMALLTASVPLLTCSFS